VFSVTGNQPNGNPTPVAIELSIAVHEGPDYNQTENRPESHLHIQAGVQIGLSE